MAFGDQGIGVVGESFYQFGANGNGVMGWARHPTGETVGVRGVAESPAGTGVVGLASGGTRGTGVTGRGSTGSGAQESVKVFKAHRIMA